jgi:hypothetical protein
LDRVRPLDTVCPGAHAKSGPGAAKINKNGMTYHLNGNTWFKPLYGANGVHYQVVAAP